MDLAPYLAPHMDIIRTFVKLNDPEHPPETKHKLNQTKRFIAGIGEAVEAIVARTSSHASPTAGSLLQPSALQLLEAGMKKHKGHAVRSGARARVCLSIVCVLTFQGSTRW